MNAAETIQAAIDKLTRLREKASPGPWEHQPYGAQNQNGDYSGADIFDANGEYLLHDVSDTDGSLISTLHATIDAQIELLEGHRKYAEASWLNVEPDDVVVKLARAILGQ